MIEVANLILTYNLIRITMAEPYRLKNKITTIRRSDKGLLPRKNFVFVDLNDNIIAKARCVYIMRVNWKMIQDLAYNSNLTKNEGYSDPLELLSDILSFYPDLEPNTNLYIIYFELLN